MNVESGFQLDLAGALRRRGVMIAATAGLIFLVGFWIAMALPNEYRAYATLLVQPQTVDQGLVKTTGAETDLNDRLLCPPARFDQLVTFRPVDMTAIPDDLAGFDFCWSSCALEHLGSLAAGRSRGPAASRVGGARHGSCRRRR